MTNKERLELNNQKIEAIIQALEGKVAGASDKSINLELPEEFSSLSSIYWFRFDANTIFVSGKKQNLGLWAYYEKENQWIKLYSEHYGYNTYQKVGNDCLISGYNTTLLYDSATKTCSNLGLGSTSFKMVENFCIIASSSDTLSKYNILDKTITKVPRPENGWGNISYLHIIKDKIIINGNNNSKKVYMYNYKTDEVKLLQEGPYYLEYANIIFDKYMLLDSGSYGGDTGLWLYSYDDDSFEYISGIKYIDTILEIDNNKVLLGSSKGNGYLKLFNLSDKSVVDIYSVSSKWSNFFRFNENKVLISSSSDTGTTGLLLYNALDNSVVNIYANYYKWDKFQKVGDVCLIGCSSGFAGFIMFNSVDDTVTKIYSNKIYWWYFQPVVGGCLVGNSVGSGATDAGLVLYNSETKTAKRIYSNGNYGKFIPDGDNFYIEIADDEKSNKKISPRKLYYNASDKTVKLISYYIGET